MSIGTIVFLGDRDREDTNNWRNIRFWYGTSGTYNNAANTQVVQAGSTFYPHMVADIFDAVTNTPKSVRYIFMDANGAFDVDEILCYELPRLSPTNHPNDIQPYTPVLNGAIRSTGCKLVNYSQTFDFNRSVNIRRVVAIFDNGAGSSNSGESFQDVSVNQPAGGSMETCD